jgi:flagellum-specific ATP synthase
MQLSTPNPMITWQRYHNALDECQFQIRSGRVMRVSNLLIESSGPKAFLGEMCRIVSNGKHGGECYGEVVGLRDGVVQIMLFGHMHGIDTQSEVIGLGRTVSAPVGNALLGRVVDSFGQPLDGKGPVAATQTFSLRGSLRNPLSRKKITDVMPTGLRAIDTFLSIGKGQRVGIFAGSGVGKSTLLGMIARQSCGDINVIALIGERGREVGEFLTQTLGEEGLARSVVVVATSDQPALVRELAAHTATAIAEYFCEQGHDVMLIMDSVTRFAMAMREIGLSVGEPATARGYTPSTFSALPKLLERAGRFEVGSITAVYTVLVEGDDLHEPVSDHMRAILDGHIVLSRDLANQGHYPSIDLLKSISRLAPDLWSKQEQQLIRKAIRLLSVHERYRDMIEVGAYHAGSNPELDRAIAIFPALEQFLSQEPEKPCSRENAFNELHQLFAAH